MDDSLEGSPDGHSTHTGIAIYVLEANFATEPSIFSSSDTEQGGEEVNGATQRATCKTPVFYRKQRPKAIPKCCTPRLVAFQASATPSLAIGGSADNNGTLNDRKMKTEIQYRISLDLQLAQKGSTPYYWPYDFTEMLRAAGDLDGLRNKVGAINPRPPGWHNGLIQLVKRLLARLLSWYTRPLGEFNAPMSQSLEEIVYVVDHLSMNMVALERRSAQSQRRNDAEARFASDRTAYIIGLFGSGRHYINEIVLRNIGERAKYFRDTIRLHPGPTPMIYSGHATMKYISRDQARPEVMSRVLDAARSGFADVIFLCRHPLDSLLTNWVWWRTYLRDNRWIVGISQVYQTTDDLCADLERNFLEFKAFAEGDPSFFARAPGPPFLSFAEFVEETELHLQAATLRLRLEDFMVNPLQEFSKIVEVMSLELDLTRLSIAPPITKPYGYLAVQERSTQFRNFIDGLSAETNRRIENIGYNLTA